MGNNLSSTGTQVFRSMKEGLIFWQIRGGCNIPKKKKIVKQEEPSTTDKQALSPQSCQTGRYGRGQALDL